MDAEKLLTVFMVKAKKIRNKREINLIKGIYQNPTTNILLNDDQLNDVKVRDKSWCPLWTLLTNPC